MSLPADVRHVVLDIEGTTSAIDFVYSVLFPYARNHMKAYVNSLATGDAGRAELLAHAERFSLQGVRDAEAGVPHVAVDVTLASELQAAQVIAAALDHMNTDRKTTALKDLQGRIWMQGYAQGELKGHVYDDVAPALQRWFSAGIGLHIYSSGSVTAQKLIFGHSVSGDLTPYLTSYFDTTTGPKREASSYAAIATAIGAEPATVLFLTDNLDEARAAIGAGMQTVVVRRPGDGGEEPGVEFTVVSDFTGL
jgi:enolase-phosphatase E1